VRKAKEPVVGILFPVFDFVKLNFDVIIDNDKLCLATVGRNHTK
jgi:hypothetical protein